MAVSPFNVAFQKYAKKNLGDKLVVLGVQTVYSSNSAIASYKKTNHVNYPMINNGGSIFGAFQQYSTPSAVLVYPDKSFRSFYPSLILSELSKAGIIDSDTAQFYGATKIVNACEEEGWGVSHTANASIDTSGGLVQNSSLILKGSLNPDGQNGSGATLLTSTIGFSKSDADAIKVVYKSNFYLYLMLKQNGFDRYEGNMFTQELPIATDWKTEIFNLDTTDFVHSIYNNEWTAYLRAKDWAPVNPEAIDTVQFQAYQQSGDGTADLNLQIKEVTFLKRGASPINHNLDNIKTTGSGQFKCFLTGNNKIKAVVPFDGNYSIVIHNSLGRQIEKLETSFLTTGTHLLKLKNSIKSKGLNFITFKSKERNVTTTVFRY